MRRPQKAMLVKVHTTQGNNQLSPSLRQGANLGYTHCTARWLGRRRSQGVGERVATADAARTALLQRDSGSPHSL